MELVFLALLHGRGRPDHLAKSAWLHKAGLRADPPPDEGTGPTATKPKSDYILRDPRLPRSPGGATM